MTQQISVMRAALASGDMYRAVVIAHSAAGTATMIFAPRLYTCSKALQALAKSAAAGEAVEAELRAGATLWFFILDELLSVLKHRSPDELLETDSVLTATSIKSACAKSKLDAKP